MKTTITTFLMITIVKLCLAQSFLNPGVSYKMYYPSICDTLGQYKGVSVKFNLIQSDNDDEFYFRNYLSVEQLKSTKDNFFFCYSFGALIGVEKEINRNFLIPYFGMETGNMVIKGIGKSAHLTPLAGISFINKHRCELSESVGYKYPFFQQEYAGYVAELSLIINLHNVEF